MEVLFEIERKQSFAAIVIQRALEVPSPEVLERIFAKSTGGD